MKIRRSLPVVAGSVVMLAARPAAGAAQLTASAELGAGALGYRAVLPSSSAAVAGARLEYAASHVALVARGRLARFEDNSGSTEGLVAATFRVARPRGPGFVLETSAEATRYRDYVRTRRLEVATGPTFSLGRYEGAVRGRIARLSLEGEGRAATGGDLRLQRRYRRALVSVLGSALAFDDRAVGWRDTTYTVAGFPFHGQYLAERQVRRAYADLEAGLHLPLGRVLWELVLGARGGAVATDPGGWMQLRGTLPVTPHAAIVAGFGRAPSVPEQNLPSAPFATVALRLRLAGAPRPVTLPVSRPAEARFAVIGSGSPRVVRLAGVRARRVEVMGDFTNWSPVALAPAGGDVWETSLVIAPGAHRVVVRMDGGAWEAPPDVPVAADEFRGAVGVVLVE